MSRKQYAGTGSVLIAVLISGALTFASGCSERKAPTIQLPETPKPPPPAPAKKATGIPVG